MTDVEMAIFGCILLDDSLHEVIFTRLSPSIFSDEDGRLIFSKMKSIFKDNKPLDILTVCENNNSLKSILLKCCEDTPLVANTLSYIAILINSYRFNLLYSDLSILLNSLDPNSSCIDTYVSSLLEIYNKQVKISDFNEKNNGLDFDEAYLNFIDDLFVKSDSFKCGFSNLDRLLGGFFHGDMITLAGRSGMGKTDFAINIALKLALNAKVDYYSLEVPTNQIMQRVISKLTKINSSKIRDKDISTQESDLIYSAYEKIVKRLKFRIDDTVSYTLSEIEGFLIKNKPNVVFIDHIGLLKPISPKKYHWEEISDISLEIKRLAKKYDCCIICLVQQSSKNERRGIDELSLSDMKGSDNIGNDADISMFIMADKSVKLSSVGFFEASINIVKNRNGETGIVNFQWYPQYHDYYEILYV